MRRNIGWRMALGALLGAGLVAVGLCAGCSPAMPAAEKPAQASEPQTLEEQADAIVAAMTTNEKIGQMVMIGIHGTELDEDSKTMLRQFHIGGIVYFDRNIKSQDQLKSLSEQLQAYAQGEAQQKVPLFLAIDEEGGTVSRGRGVIPAPPSEANIGASGQPERARMSAASTAQALHAAGINLNLAPVADVSSSDARAFSGDAQVAARFTEKAVSGYEQEGMLCALKHFPGIGKGAVDSHQEVSRVDVPRETLEREDLLPFAEIIASQRPEDFLILVSHLIYPCYDAAHSASQSRAVMTDLLRGRLGYQGIILTDDLEMGAVANHVPLRQAGANAVVAGADIVLVCHEYPHEEEVYLGIKDAVDAGEISEERLDASVRRIVLAKLAHAL
ncbi:glycoside hydrolase family 3 N-terminal domain-containing protein [Selenomonas sp.]|jgi:beta-N-acetylhexosaminidase|uniref:glycoside hydrolase family 3 N-terminal domain-containing protein n=1 Tax=Selenomonas sp. TaxID=2053611 RepID=UPI003A1022EB